MLNIGSLHTLVNFRADRGLLESFDRVCLLSGKSRTQVLKEMMHQRVLSVGQRLASQSANEKAINERLKTAVEAISERKAVESPRQWEPALYRRLKSFSNFDQPDV